MSASVGLAVGGAVIGAVGSFVYMLVFILILPDDVSDIITGIVLSLGPMIAYGILGFIVGGEIHTQKFYKS